MSRVRRLLPSSLAGLTLSIALVPALLVAPTITRPFAPRPHPVAPSLHHLALAGVDRAALAGLGRITHLPLALTPARTTSRFSLVGVTWDERDSRTPVDVQVRTRTQGVWTPWHDLQGPDDVEADPGSQDAVRGGRTQRAGTSPYWVGPSDGVQVRVDGKRLPRSMRVELVDPGTSAADSTVADRSVPASSAAAEVAQPTIVSRSGWGADESLRSGSPDYTEPIKVGFVHHTDTTNSYSPSQSASIVRSIYAYHTQSRGWSDIGYNFLIDKYGTIFEGRYGGIDRAVMGAHTGGFNAHSFAASLMGNYATAQPSSAMLTSLEKLFAWKLGRYYLDPLGTNTLVSAGGGTSRYAAGTSHTFSIISGHRDAGYTTCPGGYAYAKLGAVRSAVQALLGPSFVQPSATPASRGLLDAGGFTVRAGAVNPLSWTLTVTNATTGLVVRTLTGTATRSAPVNAVWDRLDDQQTLAPPGRYNLRLTATSADGKTARPWSTQVTVTSPVTLVAPALGAWNSSIPVSGAARAGSTVQLETMPKGATQWTAVGTATADSAGKWASSFTLTDDTDVRATTSDYPSEISRVRVAPLFTTSSPNVYGGTLTLRGTARPGSAVTLALRRAEATDWGNGRSTTADAVSGAWTVELPMNVNWAIQATADSVSTPVVTAYITPTVDTLATYIGVLGSSVPISGTGAPGGVVDLQVQPTGSSTWVVAGSATAGSDGRWSGDVPLSDDLSVRASAHGLSSSGSRSSRVRPTAAAPSLAPWNTAVPLRGTARPGALVTVSRSVGSTTTTVTTTASSAGAWSAPFTLTAPTTWSATSGGLGSASGTTAVTPTLTLPSRAVPGRLIRVGGTAQPGTAVVLAITQPGATTATRLPAVTASSSGLWQAAVTPARVGTARLTATASGVTTAAQSLPVLAVVLSAPALAVVNSPVTVSGYARPSTWLRLEARAGSATTWTAIGSVRTSTDGSWTLSYPLGDDTWVRGVTTADGASRGALTEVVTTLVAPASAKANTWISLRGTAKPGGWVGVYIRNAGEPGFALRKATTASSRGAWSASWLFTRQMAVYAASGGLRSVTRVTAAQ